MIDKSSEVRRIVEKVEKEIASLGILCRKLCVTLGYDTPRDFLTNNIFPDSKYIRSEDSDEIKMLLNSVEYQNTQGLESLQIAAELGYLNIAKLLLEIGYDPNISNNIKATPLLISSKLGDLLSSALLLRAKADPNFRCDYGITALYMAVKQENEFVASKLLKEDNTEPNIPNEDGTTPLQEAIRTKFYVVIPALINKGAKFNIEDITFDLLSWLVKFGYNDVMGKLFKEGVDPNIKSESGDTLINIARKLGFSGVVRFLRDSGSKDEDQSKVEVSCDQSTDLGKLLQSLRTKIVALDEMRDEASKAAFFHNESPSVASSSCTVTNTKVSDERMSMDL